MVSRVFRAVFSKKGMLVLAGLFALLFLVTSTYHVVYNRIAEQDWREVEKRWEDELFPNKRGDFFKPIPDEQNIGKDKRVISYFAQDAPPIGNIRYMPLGEYCEYGFREAYTKDLLASFDDGSFESEKDAAIHLLSLLEHYESEILLFEEWFDKEFYTESEFRDPLKIENLRGGLTYHEMSYIALVNFFSDRAEYRLLVEQRDLANEDLKRVGNAYKALSNDPFLVNFLIKVSYIDKVRKVFSTGLLTHQWDRETLLYLKRSLDQVDLVSMYRLMPVIEYFYLQDIMNLYDQYGQSEIDDVLFGQYEEVQSLFTTNAAEGFINWDILVLKLMRFVLPENIFLRGAADTEQFALDHVLGANSATPHVGVYFELKEVAPDYPWWRLSPDQAGPVYVNQYLELLKGITIQQLVRCGIELELYYLDNGEYPKSLDVLSSLSSEDRRNVYGEGELKYGLTQDGGCQLYSDGPSEEVKPIRGRVREKEGYNRIDFFEGMKN